MSERLVEPKPPFAYPDHHKPSWFVCHPCRTLWHDAWQDDPNCAWNVLPSCGSAIDHVMEQVTPERAAELYREGFRAAGRRRIRVTVSLAEAER